MATKDEIAALLGWLEGKFPDMAEMDGAERAAQLPLWHTALQALTPADLRRGCEWVKAAGLEKCPTIQTFRMMCVPAIYKGEAEKKTIGRVLTKTWDHETRKAAYRRLVELSDLHRDHRALEFWRTRWPEVVSEVREEMGTLPNID